MPSVTPILGNDEEFFYFLLINFIEELNPQMQFKVKDKFMSLMWLFSLCIHKEKEK